MIRLYHGSNMKIDVPDLAHGPIADDGVTFQLRRYQGGLISLHQLVEELKYAKGITFQYFFGTQRSLQLLQRL